MGIQHTDRAEERPPSPATMDERLARLERLLTAQQEHIARLEAERVSAPIAAAPLPVLLSVAPEQAAGDDAAPDVAAPPAPRHRGSSRRALLKLGGAAAAAGVAAMATAATELAHPGTAQASGIAWQTGVVNSDVQTFVEPANGSFPDPSLLAVRVGTTAPFQGLSSANSAAIAAYDTMASAIGLYATSFGGVAVAGLSDSGTGVLGKSNSWFGVNGSSSSSFGVRGTSDSSLGVYGYSFSGVGVFASSSSGDGVHAVGGRYGGNFTGSQAPLLLNPSGSIGAPTGGTHVKGEIYLDLNAALWICVANSPTATWVRLTGVQSGTPGGAIAYLPAPIRLFDSRAGQPAPLPASKGALAGQSTTTIQVTGTISVPSGATGVFGNLTVSNTQGGGDLILYPSGAPQPNASNINYVQGQTIANSFNVGLSSGGAMDLFVHVSGTDVIIDIAGYVL